MTKDESRDYPASIGKTVIINSYRVKGATGIVTQYLPRTHHYWVKLDEPIENRGNGKLSYWHKCNADNCQEC